MFENNFVPNADLRQARFKCSCTILNGQPAPRYGFAEITDSLQFMDNRLYHNFLSRYQLGGRQAPEKKIFLMKVLKFIA